MRQASISRETKETRIQATVLLDGEGRAQINTGIGFFDHMLDHVARHGLFDLEVRAEGDLHIDPHHTVEDTGICLGKAFLQAVGEPKGLARYGHAVVPMDEALAEVALDFSGRPILVFTADLPPTRLGGFDVELAEEFLRAFAVQARLTLHVELRRGKNTHHCVEAIFKALGRALRQAVTLDPRVQGVPSTKGMLEA
ncbi:MAG: imidazoleglycerol-phosphate dehydratase HisB [Candidatus Hydrogenedens sp.]|nr:imidazoleglycerol-phosphate dehydratase HisB [Candidatus Hydrogenedentota bacterium]NLF57409.1 imidazoleglycerol-phosphate dehydratase HisB [Candidatus Hydrogenedens sp.]